ncbi:MAG: AbrB/MazE/SpoVT family DNA-binding domain-containing protein [Candidatus Altiarchaeales archaeon HGW-Altiarchaeales-1]|nr:MAG: AbrB/MazE/SpoVT family DNA-binding domain-containing protein [Candidatus Altiarchaeales archaeon HGW-Altiarchaeales-1]
MNITVRKWGSCLAIKLPDIFAKEVNIHQGSRLDLLKVKDMLLLKPCTRKITLKKMLSNINENNIHSEIATGKVVGNEFF